MAGHSRSKNGVASLAYVPPIRVFVAESPLEDVDACLRGHDAGVNWRVDITRCDQAHSAPIPEAPRAPSQEETPMDKAMYDKGLGVRRAVLGDEYVDNALKNVDDFNQPLQ